MADRPDSADAITRRSLSRSVRPYRPGVDGSILGSNDPVHIGRRLRTRSEVNREGRWLSTDTTSRGDE
jgi:hypothetical protein